VLRRLRTLKQWARAPQRQASEERLQPDDPPFQRVATSELCEIEKKPRSSKELFTDKELTDLALAADPDAGVAADAVPIDELLTSEDARNADDLLPPWYMPAPAPRGLHGWRRGVVLLIVISFTATAAYGLCSTYGLLGLG
jgi:hypothetical protein